MKAGRILLFACLFLWTGVSAWAIANPENRCSRVAAGAISNARYFDPELGRFTQPDTEISDLSNPQSYNRYAYCLNDPLTYNDPSGHGFSSWWRDTKQGAAMLWDPISSAAVNLWDDAFVGGGNPALSDPNSYNALNGGTFGQPIPGVGNPATAPIKAGAAALAQAGVMMTPGGAEEEAAGLAMKEGKAALSPILKGQEGVAKSEAAAVARGETVRGNEVTFELPSGGRTRADVVTGSDGGSKLNIIESKNGPNARLTTRQTEAQKTVQQGKPLIPRGANAEAAGLTPGKPVQIDKYQVDKY